MKSYFTKFVFVGFFFMAFVVESMAQVVFTYEKGGASWKDGLYSTSEVMVFERQNDKYHLGQYFRVDKFKKDSLFRCDTLQMSIGRREIVSEETMNDLVRELQRPMDNFNASYIRKYFKMPKNKVIRKQIRRLLDEKKYNQLEFGNVEIESLKRNIISFKNFDSFLNSIRPEQNVFFISSDSWDNLQIIATNENDTVKSLSRLNMPFGQPFFFVGKNRSYNVLNLSINRIIAGILPKKSVFINSLNMHNIMEEYTRWFLDKMIDRGKVSLR